MRWGARGPDFDRIPATRSVRLRPGPRGERGDGSREAVELEPWPDPGHLPRGPADRVPGRVEELQREIGPPGDLSAQRPPAHHEQGVLRGLVAARGRSAGGRRLDPLHARVVGVGESANAVGQRLGGVVSLAGVQDLDGRVLKGDVGIRIVDVDDQRRCIECKSPEQVRRDERVGRRRRPRQGHRGRRPAAADPLLPFQGLVVGHLGDRHQDVFGCVHGTLMGPVVTTPQRIVGPHPGKDTGRPRLLPGDPIIECPGRRRVEHRSSRDAGWREPQPVCFPRRPLPVVGSDRYAWSGARRTAPPRRSG